MKLASRLSRECSRPVRGELEVSLDVPNLGQAVGFYSNVFDAWPMAIERRLAWFDVPDSTLCIELREALTPTATRLRLCTEQRRVQQVAAQLSRSGVTVLQAGLTRQEPPERSASTTRDTTTGSFTRRSSPPPPPEVRASRDPGARSSAAPGQRGQPQRLRHASTSSELMTTPWRVATANHPSIGRASFARNGALTCAAPR